MPQVLDILRGLTVDPKNDVFIISGRGRAELGDWFASVVRGVQNASVIQGHSACAACSLHTTDLGGSCQTMDTNQSPSSFAPAHAGDTQSKHKNKQAAGLRRDAGQER